MRNRRVGSHFASSPKICGSGLKRMVVPRLLGARPSFSSAPFGFPRANVILIELLSARDLDFEFFRQRVHHRHADAVQAARGLVNLGIEFAARMQRAHDHFERGFFREFRMRIDRDAAAVVGHGDVAVVAELDLDEGRVARQRLVHRVVDHFGEEMMQRLLVGAADIHAGAAANRLEPLQHLDVMRGIAAVAAGAGFALGSALGGFAAAIEVGEQIAVRPRPFCRRRAFLAVFLAGLAGFLVFLAM